MQAALPNRLSKVKSSARLVSSPAVVTDHESASLRRMMRMLNQSGHDVNSPRAEDEMLPKQTLELNPGHPIVVQLNTLRTSSPLVAVTVAEQLFDNALVAAGLMDDSRTMLPRLNRLLELVTSAGAGAGAGAGADAGAADAAPSDLSSAAAAEALQDLMNDAVGDALKGTGMAPPPAPASSDRKSKAERAKERRREEAEAAKASAE